MSGLLRRGLREFERWRMVKRVRWVLYWNGYSSAHLADADIHRRLTIASIRENMKFFGYPCDELTDEEIELGVQGCAEFIQSAGVDADAFAEAAAEIFSVPREEA